MLNVAAMLDCCSYGYAPLAGVLVLLAAGAANGDTLRLGIAGDRFLKPYGIVILFMSQVRHQQCLQKRGLCRPLTSQQHALCLKRFDTALAAHASTCLTPRDAACPGHSAAAGLRASKPGVVI